MKIIDISWPISVAMTQYKDKKMVSIEQLKKEGSYCMEHRLTLHSHTGTHIDAPAHFIEGANTMDQIPLTTFIGRCFVADMMHIDVAIDRTSLEGIPAHPTDIVLFKTRNSLLNANAPFNPNFVYLNATGAQYVVQQGWKVVGIDYVGIERSQPHHETHIILGKANIPIVEGLRLHGVAEGFYTLYVLPLNIQNVEAAPARALLIT